MLHFTFVFDISVQIFLQVGKFDDTVDFLVCQPLTCNYISLSDSCLKKSLTRIFPVRVGKKNLQTKQLRGTSYFLYSSSKVVIFKQCKP